MNQKPQQQAPRQDKVFLGIFFGILAFLGFSVISVAVKLLSESAYSVIDISFYRFFIGTLIMGAYIIIWRRFDLLYVRKKGAVFLRALIGVIATLLTFGAVKYLPLADATLLFMTATLITPAMAYFILKERMGWRRWIAVIIGLCGVTLVVQATGEFKLLGTLIAAGAALMHSSAQTVLRVLKNESAFSTTFYFLLGGCISLFPFISTSAGTLHSAFNLSLIITIGVIGILAQYCLARAFTFAPASSVSPFAFSGLIWAIVFDITIWSIIPSYPVFIGAAIIISAKLYILRREHILQKKAQTT